VVACRPFDARLPLCARALVAWRLGRGAARPSSAALRKAFETNRAYIVKVGGPKRAGTGVMVGADGHVATSVDFSGLQSAQVTVENEDKAAKVLLADAKLGIAVLRIEPPGEFKAAAVRLDAAFTEATGSWPSRGRPTARSPHRRPGVLGPTPSSPFVECDLRVPNGSPLFDPSGKLVAITVKQRGKLSTRALPLFAVKRQLTASEPEGKAP